VVHRNVEEALDLRGVQVDAQHAVCARAGDEVGHQLGGDGHAALVLAVLAGVAEVGNDRGDARALARRRQSANTSSSIRLSFTGELVLHTM
jgi:ABC-type phosphate/phosphonate transport system substrate-binding protein